jgi:hypothetical protein
MSFAGDCGHWILHALSTVGTTPHIVGNPTCVSAVDGLEQTRHA